MHKRSKLSHKGENGKVLIIGGSDDLVGAPALAAMSALACMRSGIDLVTVFAPEKPGFVINSFAPDLIVKKFKDQKFSNKNVLAAIELSETNDVVLIGPGLGRKKETLAFAKEFVKKCKKPIVIDADAIKACAGMKFNGATILTPHEMEFEIFSEEKITEKNLAEKKKIVLETAKKHNCNILLKGHIDIISNGKKIALNKTGNSGMTVGGTGDVLAGLCSAYVSLGMELFDAAKKAAFVNGKIGDELLKEKGFGFIASDFIEKIPKWTKKILK
ncbi:MAG: NAD(P)H-hydrate dehydratase [Candidatus Diapherotrites archaeon CG11_big_fil_rev_8_21_14_0_20_37_9]|nr:MAG: NAD(P)H-hydrate dehydratase [Candidatus Diapherotrites archaeon CG11_big_fil_rev_8_21_14_0_20_37_9]